MWHLLLDIRRRTHDKWGITFREISHKPLYEDTLDLDNSISHGAYYLCFVSGCRHWQEWFNGVLQFVFMLYRPCFAQSWSVYHTLCMGPCKERYHLSLFFFHSPCFPLEMWIFWGLQCAGLALWASSRNSKFVAHIGAWKLSLLVMPALLLLGAERIRGLQERLICQGAHTQEQTHSSTIQKHTINTRQICPHTHKAHVSMHVSTDSNAHFDAHITCINSGTLVKTYVRASSLWWCWSVNK